MNRILTWMSVVAVIACVGCAPLHHSEAVGQMGATTSRCATDSNYQRLAFWVGDWEVYDSTGIYYARQRIRQTLGSCAITAEWKSGAGYVGLGVSGFDVKSGEWKQIYLSNQWPAPDGIAVRRSDPAYNGPGIRFIPADPPTGNGERARVTILPLSGHRALQLFEASSDGGVTWRVVFKAEHRPAVSGGF